MNDDANTNILTNDPAGEAAVWHVSGEAGPMLVGATPDPRTVADIRFVDAALRSLAASEAPDAIERRRMRDAAIRTTRLHAVEAMARGTLSPRARQRTLPKWPLAAAAAAMIAVGFVAWLVNTAPSGVQRAARSTVESEESRREEFGAEIREYFPVVAAFTPIEFSDDSAIETANKLDDLDSQVDALAILGGQTVDN